MREKLIKLIASGSIKCFEGECRNCEYDDSNPNCQNQLIADYLIENGVVIPVRCEECAYSERYAESRNLYECKVDKMIMRKYDFCNYGEPKESEEE